MKRILAAACAALAFAVPRCAAFGANLVSKDIGDPEANAWEAGQWVTCGGDVIVLDERPADAPTNAKSVRFETRYGDHAFGGWNAHLKDNVLPGRPRKLTGWARLGNDDSWGMSFDFVDANTNKFGISMHPVGDPKGKFKLTREWQKFEMDFPEVAGKDKKPLAYPVKFDGVSQNNWGDRNSPPKTRQFDVYDLRLWTDMEGVAEEERPYSLSVSYPVVGNTFFFGEDKPRLVISAGSWIGRELEAKAVSADGTTRDIAVPPLSILDSASAVVTLPFDEPGAYKVEITASGFPKPIVEKSRYVVCLKPRELTEEEKEASPYGINVHGGGYVGYEKFARLGFTWVRDYAYTWGWLLRARGDGKYAGWPWYPKIVKAAEDVGLKTLPCLMGAFAAKMDAKEGDPSLSPSTEWRRNMALIVSTFDTLSAFEMDNECDTLMFRHFDAYKRYCSAFGAIMKAARPDARAVSPGLAGIYVEETQKLVESGAFKDIDVVNGHRYCGKDGPEYSKANLNTGMSEAKPAYLRDVWRHWKKAATCDGKFRELWVTEWGWDTLAGQPVSEWEQAAYLQRKWVLAMGNGVEKMFWYWYYDDNTDTPNYFFAGCGIFDRWRNPKPSAAAFSALRTFIPGKYEYLGTANLGPNHMVQIVKADGKVVALAYKIRKDGPDLEIDDEKAEKVTDMFGRELKASWSFTGRRKRKLDIAPTWYVGLDESSDWLKQCPIDIESDFYVRNVGGEPVRVSVAQPGRFEYSVEPPKGWTVEKKPYGFDVTGPAGLKRGNTSFTVTGRNGKVSKTMAIEVDVVPQAYAKSKAASFDGKFTMNVTNQSADDQDFTVKAELPAGWAIEPALAQTGSLKPEETKTLEFRLVESAPVDPAAKGAANPKLSIVNAKGMQVDYAPVIPREWTMRSVDLGKIKFDGDLSDWSDRNLVNSFMIGPNGDKDPTKVYIAYCPEGLVAALDVDDSRCFTADPGSFWRAADCLEVMITTPDGAKFEEGAAWGPFDHQMWFCPMLEQKNMYCGYWCNGKDQKVYRKGGDNERKGAWWVGDASRNVPEGSRSAMVKTPRGYRAEMFIPAEQLKGWEKMKPGATIGLSFTLVVEDLKNSQHELYWPNSKRDNLMKKPWTWARVKLAE